VGRDAVVEQARRTHPPEQRFQHVIGLPPGPTWRSASPFPRTGPRARAPRPRRHAPASATYTGSGSSAVGPAGASPRSRSSRCG
jgi:hypothetical protein